MSVHLGKTSVLTSISEVFAWITAHNAHVRWLASANLSTRLASSLMRFSADCGMHRGCTNDEGVAHVLRYIRESAVSLIAVQAAIAVARNGSGVDKKTR